MEEKGFKLKLTSIFSADVIRYNRLMRDGEEAVVRDLTTNRVIITDIIQKHIGRVIDSSGGNILAGVGSVVDAVKCPVKVQEKHQEMKGGI